ncbi:hypothetical protein D5R40_32315 [Okeania hirsuta]|uniref:Uncharacterized protein n=1 Tax=Okeania hirsuta TaxID=1458930 RepID=A0A3N6P8H6_9CYAN|nr:hypothetical protein [Okeania hirsuta]RQH19812.1 hypothetical protein D5R40_32315 [Okeania hirsuta]
MFDDPAIRLHLDGFEPPKQQFELILHHVNRGAYVWEVAEEIQVFAEVEWEEDGVNLLIMVKGNRRKKGWGSRCSFIFKLKISRLIITPTLLLQTKHLLHVFSRQVPICGRGRRHGEMGVEKIIPENASITDTLSGTFLLR